MGLAAVALLLAAGTAQLRTARVDTFVLANAALAEPPPQAATSTTADAATIETQWFAVNAHRLRPGDGTVYAWRAFDRGEVFTIDDERYRKLTIWTAARLPQRDTRWQIGSTNDVRVIYVKGGSAWPERACSGVLASGSVRVRPRWRGMHVDVHGELDKACDGGTIALSFDAMPIAFDALTPWMGRAAEHPYRETYP